MKLSPMRFAGFTWHHNPKSLEIASEKKVVKLEIPYSTDVLQNFGESPKVISGSGELYGDDCLQQYEKLRELYEKGGCEILCLPKLASLYACFERLSIVAKPSASVLEYKFSFTVVKEKPAFSLQKKEVVCDSDTSLWDISYSYDVDVKKLIELNKQIMFINDIKKGECIKLC